jgi:hypothetical protein
MKYWEIIADNLKKAVWSLGYVQCWVAKREQSGLLMRISANLFATSPSPSNPLASLFVIAIDSVIGRLQMKANIVATT